MKKTVASIFILCIFFSLSAQNPYGESEDEWLNDPLRFLLAENYQTTTWIDVGIGNPRKSVKNLIEGKVLIGYDYNGEISIISEDNSIFHTHDIEVNADFNPDKGVIKGSDDIGEYVTLEFNCEMYFSNVQKEKEYFGPTKIIYKFYTSGLFIVSEYSENIDGNVKVTILTNYMGTYSLKQVNKIMQIIS